MIFFVSLHSNLRFMTFKQFSMERFGEMVQKIPIDAGFTCPNRDGTLGTSGCTFCRNDAFTPRYCSAKKSISEQIADGIAFHQRRGRFSNSYLAYFQSFSNTYAPLDQLKSIYREALDHPQVKGIVIGTRPDCIDEAKLDFFAELNRQKFVSIEYGIETCNDTTLKRIHRGHDFATSASAVTQSVQHGIFTGAHFIIGLPGENKSDWINNIQQINQLKINSVKFHQLQIFKDTALEADFKTHPSDYHLFSIEEYVDLMVDLVGRLNPEVVIERLASEVPPQYLSANPWQGTRYDVILQKIRMKLKERGI